MKNPLEDRYNHTKIEAKWQKVWLDTRLYVSDINGASKPYYNLMMFPYPSAEGLHVGNMYAFTGSDIHGRYKRMRGYEVFEPIGLDGFGIHSENYALKVGRHPMDHARITQKHFYEQLHQIGAMFDFSRTLETYDPSYYRWTQWLFIQMFKAGLAYRAKAEVNFCPSCKTVLADEQVIDGACERCGNQVEKRALEQWFFRITAYAEKLLGNIPKLQWADKVKVAQTNWIGKKEGIIITYPVVLKDGKQVGEVACFTTRPDTNFGATFVVIAPEHPLISQLSGVISEEQRVRISQYCDQTKKIAPNERIAAGRTKTGVDTGLYCLNQLNNQKLPLYVSDFVLMGFGTGAVVGVPGHDIRDFQFAQAFGLPVKRVVVAGGTDADTSPITKVEQVQEDEGIMVESGFLNGFDIVTAKGKMMDFLEEKGWGKRTSTYHLRDWLISRQRYWGPPIPMIYCKACAKEGRSYTAVANENLDASSVASVSSPLANGAKSSEAAQNFVRSLRTSVIPAKAGIHDYNWNSAGWFPVPEDQLPLLLPRIEDYKPSSDGVAPLSKHKEFFDTVCPCCGKPAVRETDVSDTFLDSSWYFLRYLSIDARNLKSQISMTKQIQNSKNQNSKHHLGFGAYDLELPWNREVTRHWLPVDMYTGGAEHSVLHLLYSRYITMVLNDLGYLDFEEPFENFFAHGLIIKDGAKMSKSKGNVVNPDEYIAKYGADAVRLYLMFIGPFSQGGDFRDTGMEGMARWVGRVWRIIQNSLCTAGVLSRAFSLPTSSSRVPISRSCQAVDHTNTVSPILEDKGSILRDCGRSKGVPQPAPPLKGKIQTSESIVRLLNKTIAKVTDDMEKRRYNTAIASLMELTNAIMDEGGAMGEGELKKLILLLAPFAPHLTEEVWSLVNGKKIYTDPEDSVHHQPWPSYDPKALEEEDVQIIVQVNGKLRDTLTVTVEDSKKQESIEKKARESAKIQPYISKGVKKVVFVPGKLVNFVVGN